jgi:hypothetical protein
MAQVGGEVRIAGDADLLNSTHFDALAQAGEFPGPVVQHRQVGTLSHQHNAVEAQVRRAIDEFVETENGLPPGPGVAHGMQ